jgi:hypothetical protein
MHVCPFHPLGYQMFLKLMYGFEEFHLLIVQLECTFK